MTTTKFESVEEILAHYGVPGQKWGIRRTDSSLAKARSARETSGKSSPKASKSSGDSPKETRKEAKAKRKEAKSAKKKTESGEDSDLRKDKDKTRYKTPAKKLTNEELNQRIKRMETEKRYSDLNKRTISAGEKIATDILKNVGTTTGSKIGNGITQLAVRASIEKNLAGAGASPARKAEAKDLAKQIVPKK